MLWVILIAVSIGTAAPCLYRAWLYFQRKLKESDDEVEQQQLRDYLGP